MQYGKVLLLAALCSLAGVFTSSALAQQTVTLTMAVNESSWGGTSPEVGVHTVNAGEPIAITATPAAGYQFSQWNGGGNVVITDETKASTTATLSKNATVTAVFNASSGTTAELTMAVNDVLWGSTNPTVGVHTVNVGEAVAIAATPATGYVFSMWTGGGNVIIANETLASTTATLSKNATVTAVFAAAPQEVQLTIAVAPDSAGTTTPEVGTHAYNAGDKVAIIAKASSGYGFYEWTASGGVTVQNSTSSTTTATLSGDGAVTAVFMPDSLVDLVIGLVNIKTTNSALGKDRIILNKGVVPTGFPALTAESVVTMVVGGCFFRCSNFTVDAAKGLYVSKLKQADGSTVHLKIDTVKKIWSFSATGASAFNSLTFNFNPTTCKTEVLIYMNVGSVNYGKVFSVDENTTWKWKNGEDLTEAMNIEKASGKYKTNTNIDPLGKKDNFNIPLSTIGGFTPVKSMFNGVDVSVRIGNLSYDSVFTLVQPNVDKELYKGAADTGVGLVKMTLKQDGLVYLLTLNICKADCSVVRGPDINVRVTIGSIFNKSFKISAIQTTDLKYKAP